MNNTQKDWVSGALLGMPLGLAVAAAIGTAWTAGIGIVGAIGFNLLVRKGK